MLNRFTSAAQSEVLGAVARRGLIHITDYYPDIPLDKRLRGVTGRARLTDQQLAQLNAKYISQEEV